MNIIDSTLGELKSLLNSYCNFFLLNSSFHSRYRSHFTDQPQLPAVKDYINIIDSTLGELKSLLMAVGRIQIQSPLISNTETVKEIYSKRNLDDHIAHLVLELNWHYVVMLSEVCLKGDCKISLNLSLP